jgi:hypothetical protein
LNDFILGGASGVPCLSIQGKKTLGLTFGGCTWQWRLLSHLLVEGVVWSLDLLLVEVSFLDKLFCSRDVIPVVVLLVLQVSVCFGGVFVLFLFFFCFRLCASFMSRLALVILLLQRLGVIDIVLLLIYSFIEKTLRTCSGEEAWF